MGWREVKTRLLTYEAIALVQERPLLYSGEKGDRETWTDLRSMLKPELNGLVGGWADGDIKKLSKKAVVCQTGEAWKGKS